MSVRLDSTPLITTQVAKLQKIEKTRHRLTDLVCCVTCCFPLCWLIFGARSLCDCCQYDAEHPEEQKLTRCWQIGMELRVPPENDCDLVCQAMSWAACRNGLYRLCGGEHLEEVLYGEERELRRQVHTVIEEP